MGLNTCGERGENRIDWGRSWRVVGFHRHLWSWEGLSWGSGVGQGGSMLSSPQLWAVRKEGRVVLFGWGQFPGRISLRAGEWEVVWGEPESLSAAFTTSLSQNTFSLSSNHILDVYCKLMSPESQQPPSSGQGTFQNHLEGEKKGKY